MAQHKTSGETPVSWALLTEGVSQARLDAHRLKHLLDRGRAVADASENKEEIYKQIGDLLLTIPQRVEALERSLDRTSYALSMLGADHLRDRLPMSDRSLVDDAMFKARVASIAYRFLQRKADLSPPLGEPGGICHLVRRIHEEVRDPRLKEELVSDVQLGLKLENAEAAKVYDLEVDPGPGGRWKKLQIMPHAQYRMDQRSVTVHDIQTALQGFLKEWSDDKSRKGFRSVRWETDMARRESITWTNTKTKLTVVFVVAAPDTVRIITTYWEGKQDPRPLGKGSCPV